MFTYEEETRYCWINGASLEPEKQFELVGTVIGLALYNGVILGISFPNLVYKKLLDEEIGLEDVKQGFPSLGKGLQQLLDWKDGDVSDIFMRSFEISYEVYGEVKTFPLIENGENILVTNDNRQEYVKLYINHLVNESVKRQFGAFRRGFHRVCGGRALKMCRAEELELLICGTTELDFGDLEKGAQYDEYEADHIVIKWFWEVVHAMDFEQKKHLLNFVTASDRVPLKGLGNLTFVIQRNGPDTDRLPTALTCFGRLLLPEYASKEKLKERLLVAILNAKGFGLV
ncbi:putative E3 ubiquitin-protein ligase HTD2 [Irineochytrium annulatum]|nr:putative E3 ubiquitin-protein ligase HTD2 [Irineochytrium annulatum]